DAVLRSDERELGVCLADVGAGSTEIAVFHQGAVAYTGVVPIGGDHFTSDLSVGLCTPVNEAEKLKKLYGNAIVTLIPEGNEVEVPSVGDRPSRLLTQRLLGEILEPRARELCEMLRESMRQSGMFEGCGAGRGARGGGVWGRAGGGFFWVGGVRVCGVCTIFPNPVPESRCALPGLCRSQKCR